MFRFLLTFCLDFARSSVEIKGDLVVVWVLEKKTIYCRTPNYLTLSSCDVWEHVTQWSFSLHPYPIHMGQKAVCTFGSFLFWLTFSNELVFFVWVFMGLLNFRFKRKWRNTFPSQICIMLGLSVLRTIQVQVLRIHYFLKCLWLSQ